MNVYTLKASKMWKRNLCSMIIYFGLKRNTTAGFFLHRFLPHLATAFDNKDMGLLKSCIVVETRVQLLSIV